MNMGHEGARALRAVRGAECEGRSERERDGEAKRGEDQERGRGEVGRSVVAWGEGVGG